ncbi:MAG: HigA family addiction module antitoxin [Roseiarcus sp.]
MVSRIGENIGDAFEVEIVDHHQEIATMTKDEIFHARPDGFAMEPVHPGEVLREEIAARGLTAHALGLKLRVPANRLTEIINGKRGVTAGAALRLSRYFGPGAAFWLNLQSQYDLAMAEKRLGAKIRAEVEAAA